MLCPFFPGCYSIFPIVCVQFIEPRSNRCLALSLPHSQKSLPSLPIQRKLYCGQDLKVPWGFYNCCRQLLKLVNSWSKLLKLWPAVKSCWQLVTAVKAANRCKKNCQRHWHWLQLKWLWLLKKLCCNPQALPKVSNFANIGEILWWRNWSLDISCWFR